MSRSPRPLVLISTVVVFAFVGAAAHAWDKEGVKAAAERVSKEFVGTTFVAKLTLGAAQHYYVLPDGTPADESGKRQGKGGADHRTLWVPGGKIKVAAGQIGRTIHVWPKKKEIRILLHDKPESYLNAAIVHILFDRETTPSDFEASKIAQALVSLIEVEGYEPGRAIAEAFDEAIDRTATSSPSDLSPAPLLGDSGPTVLTLQAIAEPSSAAPGGEVRLILAYELTGPAAGVEVTESRTLRLGDRVMPTYPVAEEVVHAPGPVRSSYRQPLPGSISPGLYTFEGQVCVGADCIQRSVTFEVR